MMRRPPIDGTVLVYALLISVTVTYGPGIVLSLQQQVDLHLQARVGRLRHRAFTLWQQDHGIWDGSADGRSP